MGNYCILLCSRTQSWPYAKIFPLEEDLFALGWLSRIFVERKLSWGFLRIGCPLYNLLSYSISRMWFTLLARHSTPYLTADVLRDTKIKGLLTRQKDRQSIRLVNWTYFFCFSQDICSDVSWLQCDIDKSAFGV